MVNADLDNWTGFEAAHIFPLVFEGLWNDYNYGCWITSPLNGEEIKGGKINSVQNGYCFAAIYTSSLIRIWFESTQMYVYTLYILYKSLIANSYIRIITRLYAFVMMERVSLESLLINDLSMIPKDQLISSYVGTSGRLF